MYTINCKGKIIKLDDPLVMGILNTTPDSFYRPVPFSGIDGIVETARQMLADGADIIDIGGQSTRPGSKRISAKEEMLRVIPAVEAIQVKFPGIIISIDTFYSDVAVAAVDAGASIVNDISAGNMDKSMLSAVAGLKVPFICVHMKGEPSTMQREPHYENVVREVLDYFIAKTDECRQAGITDLIIDPGFGFGKTIAHNFSLLKNLGVFSITGKPILAGLSRKSTIYKTLGVEAADALNGTTVLNSLALANGASILRVHDVKEAKEAIRLFSAYKKAPQN